MTQNFVHGGRVVFTNDGHGDFNPSTPCLVDYAFSQGGLRSPLGVDIM